MSCATIKDNLAFVSAEICVRVLGFFVADMIGAVVFVLLCIFDDFRKVFDAVLQFHHALLCRLSGFGFHRNFVFQFCKGADFIIALCGDF